MKYFHLYEIFLKNSLMRMMENRFDFLFRAIPTTLTIGLSLAAISFLFNSLGMLAGWRKEELYLLLGLYNVIWGLFFGAFIQNMSRINRYVNRGDLDLFLTKPINSQFYVSLRDPIDFGEAATFISGMAITFFSIQLLHLNISSHQIILTALLVINSVVICYSLWFASLISSFWIGRVPGLHEAFISLYQINRYPLDIFNHALRLIFTFALPMYVVVNFPASFLLGRSGSISIIPVITVGVVCLILSSKFWNFALKRYSSASS